MTAVLILLIVLVVVALAGLALALPYLRPKADIAALATARTEALERAAKARRDGKTGLAEEHEATAARLLDQIERLGGSAL